jgi:hypothetical protein
MYKTWDPHKPVDTLFKQIQDCGDYTEARGITIGPAQQISVAYVKIFATGRFMSACFIWNEEESADKTWTNFKIINIQRVQTQASNTGQ